MIKLYGRKQTIKLNNRREDIAGAIEHVRQQLCVYHVSSENCKRALDTLEDTLNTITQSASDAVPIFVDIRRTMYRIELRVTISGPEITFVNETLADSETIMQEYGPETENLIRDLVVRGNVRRIRSRYSSGVNRVDILVEQNDKAMLYETMGALGLGVAAGLAARYLCSHGMAEMLNNYIFSPLYSLFLTAIAMIMVPMVFFSIFTSVSGFSDLGALGRTGGKVFGLYMTTTLIGIAGAISMNYLFVPGREGMINLPEIELISQEPALELSLMDKLLSIVPRNFVGAFGAADMLQVMFLAVLLGIACTQIGRFSLPLKSAFEALSALFTRATFIISNFLPYAIFGAMAQMALTMEWSSVGALASWVGVYLVSIVVQFMVYLLLIWLVGRLNPLVFVRKFIPATLTAFFTSSSNATIPTTMACCQKMGISRKVYSFSVPLGANINMDGTSIFFISTTLFMAGAYGMNVSVGELISLITSVMLLSVALPGVPGAATAATLMLFAIVGVPAEAFGLVLGLIPVLELFQTALNITGDGVVTAIVAKSEGEMELREFYS